jgi:hypothetical protein
LQDTARKEKKLIRIRTRFIVASFIDLIYYSEP